MSNSDSAPEAGATGDVRPSLGEFGQLLGHLVARALLDVLRSQELRTEVRGLVLALSSTARARTNDLSLPEAARAIGVSNATFRRLALTPSYYAGDERSPRFDLEDVRRQLRERGPRPTTPAPKQTRDSNDVDVSCVTRGGLRRAS